MVTFNRSKFYSIPSFPFCLLKFTDFFLFWTFAVHKQSCEKKPNIPVEAQQAIIVFALCLFCRHQRRLLSFAALPPSMTMLFCLTSPPMAMLTMLLSPCLMRLLSLVIWQINGLSKSSPLNTSEKNRLLFLNSCPTPTLSLSLSLFLSRCCDFHCLLNDFCFPRKFKQCCMQSQTRITYQPFRLFLSLNTPVLKKISSNFLNSKILRFSQYYHNRKKKMHMIDYYGSIRKPPAVVLAHSCLSLVRGRGNCFNDLIMWSCAFLRFFWLKGQKLGVWELIRWIYYVEMCFTRFRLSKEERLVAPADAWLWWTRNALSFPWALFIPQLSCSAACRCRERGRQTRIGPESREKARRKRSASG